MKADTRNRQKVHRRWASVQDQVPRQQSDSSAVLGVEVRKSSAKSSVKSSMLTKPGQSSSLSHGKGETHWYSTSCKLSHM